MGVGIIAYWLLRIPEVLLLSSLAPIISSFLITYDLSTHAHRFEILGLVFSFTGLVGYLLFRFIPRSFRSTLTITTLVYFLFALSLTLNSGYYLAFILFLIGLILHHAPRIFPFKELPYLATAALAWSLRVFIHESHLSLVYLPHFWLFLGALTYALHTLPQIKLPVHYRRAGLLMTLLTPIIVSPSLFASQSLIHPAVSSYLASLLFTLDYSLYRRPLALYFSGGLAIFGWFLHGHYLHLTDFLIYTLPLGVYFTAIGYHRLLEKDHTNYQNVTFLGALTIFFPSFVAAFGSEAGKHAIVMFTIGCAYLGAGITLPQRFYRLIGVTGIVLAVLPQTYTYLLHLPRWITLALLGILFISGALYLLLKRQHPKILG
jgi:hypothetical protein